MGFATEAEMGGQVNNDEKWNKAAFRVGSNDSFDPAEVSGVLGFEPTTSGRKGEIRGNGRPPRRNSIWSLHSPLASQEPLDKHLEWLLDRLEPKADAIGGISQRYEVDFFCGFSSENGQGGCTFDASLLDRLARLKLPLVLDLYPPGPISPESDQD